jgi:hypothetical protein
MMHDVHTIKLIYIYYINLLYTKFGTDSNISFQYHLTYLLIVILI